MVEELVAVIIQHLDVYHLGIYERILPLAEMTYLVIAANSVVAEAERETLRGCACAS